ncbi:MAG: hypothetical protein AAFR11_00765 [Pseudomonadota bacterium]
MNRLLKIAAAAAAAASLSGCIIVKECGCDDDYDFAQRTPVEAGDTTDSSEES